jgi:O-antigen/teichoic acid export membrane protein
MLRKLSFINANLLSNLFNQILGVGFPILIQFYTIRHFKLSDIGQLSLLNSYWTFFTIGLSFFNLYLLKIFASDNGEDNVKSYITNATLLMYTIIIIPFLFLVYFLNSEFPELTLLILLTSLPVLTSPLSFEIYFQARLQNNYILFRRLFLKSMIVICILLFAKDNSDFIVYVSIICIFSVVENLINFQKLSKYYSFNAISLNTIFDVFKNSFKLIPHNLTYNILPNVVIICSASFITIEELSVYSILIRIVNLATTFITSSIMVLYPIKVNNAIQNYSIDGTNYLKYTAFFSAIVFILMVFSQKIIFFLFLGKYKVDNMIVEFSILSIFVFFHSIYNYLVFNYYFIKDRYGFVTFLNIVLLVVYFIELALVKYNMVNYQFSLFFILPYPMIFFLIIIDYYKLKFKNLCVA